jgi:type II secretory pathway predicted ATPase ExeA
MEGQRHLDRATTLGTDSSKSERVVSSRLRTLQRLRAAVANGQAGPVLITGEPGAGKTWLWRRLVEDLPVGWRSANVDLASAMDAIEFLRLIGHSLGVTIPDRLGGARLLLQSTLEDESTDGRRWLLAVDEAHRGSAEVWDEIQALRNQLGLTTGFAALCILGQTELTRELSTRRLTPVATGLSAKFHLMPLDLDEARELLARDEPDAYIKEHLLEELHRDARGNPGRLLRLAGLRPPTMRVDPDDALNRELSPGRPAATGLAASRIMIASVPDRATSASAEAVASRAENGRSNPPPLLPTRPPIRLEDGLVEVGWEGDLDSDVARGKEADTSPEDPGPEASSFDEEPVEDRYAALQAWTEWTRNQGRFAAIETTDDPASGLETGPDEVDCGLEVASDPKELFASQPSSTAESTAGTAIANVRAEAQHDFAPYSQLFTRLRQSR